MKNMMIKTAIVISSISLLTLACTSPAKKANSSSSHATKTAKALEVEKKNREHEEELQDMRDRNRIINAKNQLAKAPEAVVAKSQTMNVFANPQSQKIEVLPQSSVLPKTDFELYQEMQTQYEQNNQPAFFSRLQLFQKQYPKSHLMDEVLYLGGLMSLSNKNYGASLKYFNQISKQYPTCSKSSAASFAKGIALKKMNLREQARNVFAGVIKKYPGSVEAQRASNELKIIR